METNRSANLVAVVTMPSPKTVGEQLDDTSSILYSRSQSTMSRSECTICESCTMDTEPAAGTSDIDNVMQQGAETKQMEGVYAQACPVPLCPLVNTATLLCCSSILSPLSLVLQPKS